MMEADERAGSRRGDPLSRGRSDRTSIQGVAPGKVLEGSRGQVAGSELELGILEGCQSSARMSQGPG